MADFFGKVKDGFNKGVATVSTGSKTMIEKSKCNTVIKSLEDEKKQLAEIMGNKVYGFCTENPEGDIPRDEVINFINEINARNAQIAEQEKRIQELDAEMNQVRGNNVVTGATTVCSCGHTNAAGVKFCAGCGKKMD